MAKKKQNKKQTSVVSETAVITKEKPLSPPKPKWEIKDRIYRLKNGKTPLSYMIKAANIYYFDEEVGYERELKYCENQRTSFVDEMKGEHRLSHIIFRDGVLIVPKNKVTLQKLLSVYHPLKDRLYYEVDEVKKAETQLDWLEFEVAALNAANNLDIDMAEAVMRVELGSNVSKMSSKEVRRDLLLFAKENPKLFLELVTDENVQLRNIGIKATEQGIIELSQDQRSFSWKGTGRKLMSVPFEENPYSALAAWLKTDEGIEVYSSIEKRLK